MNSTNLSIRLIRCGLFSAKYNFQVKYKNGSDKHIAKTLSCLLIDLLTERNYPDDFTTFQMEPEPDTQLDKDYGWQEHDFF